MSSRRVNSESQTLNSLTLIMRSLQKLDCQMSDMNKKVNERLDKLDTQVERVEKILVATESQRINPGNTALIDYLFPSRSS